MDAALSLRCRRGIRLIDVERVSGFVLQAERACGFVNRHTGGDGRGARA